MQELLLGFADYILQWPYWLWSLFNSDDRPALLGFALLNLMVILLYLIHTKSSPPSSPRDSRSVHSNYPFYETKISYGSPVAETDTEYNIDDNFYKSYNDHVYLKVISLNPSSDTVISASKRSKSERRRKVPASISTTNPNSIGESRHRYISELQTEKFSPSTVTTPVTPITSSVVPKDPISESENLGNPASLNSVDEGRHSYSSEETLRSADDQQFDEFIRKFKSGHFSRQLQGAAADQKQQYISDASPVRV